MLDEIAIRISVAYLLSMLEKLRLTNFRCFEDHTIEFGRFNVIVGKNNSGKSTVIDALKLISNVFRYSPYRNEYLEDRDIPFSKINLRYNYSDKETIIFAKFSDGTELEVIFPIKQRPFANILRNGKNIKNKQLREKILGIIPPVRTFEEDEEMQDRDYIRSIVISHLAPKHFRNIWHYFPDGFEEFRDLIEKTWPGYSIEAPQVQTSADRINMYYTEDRIAREIFWAGHGFQIWLQLMTFLVKLGPKETLILDEPDIYLHQDLQKKLVNICRDRTNQIIIATHAVDIIEEVDPEDIIAIDKKANMSKNLSTINDVQTCINQLGSYQNLKLVNFIRGKTCLFVEGKDLKILKKFAKKFNIERFASEDGFSVNPIQGFSNWERLKHVDWIFKNTFGEKIKCYVILDRDYYPQPTIENVIQELKKKNVKVHIWSKKELENYLINPIALYRMFANKYCNRYPNTDLPLTESEFQERLLELFENLKEDVRAQMLLRELRARPKTSKDETTEFVQMSRDFEIKWADIEYRRQAIPGKKFFSNMNDWLNKDFKIFISIDYALHSIESEELDPEIANTIKDFLKLIDES